MIDARTHCPSCLSPRCATKPDAPLLDILADLDRAHDVTAWHDALKAPRSTRQAARRAHTIASRKGWATRHRQQIERDPMVSRYPAAFLTLDRAGECNKGRAASIGRQGCADTGVTLYAAKHGNSATSPVPVNAGTGFMLGGM